LDPAVTTLLAALVGAGAALGAQALAPVVQSKRAHQQWLQDERAELCESLVALGYEADQAIDALRTAVVESEFNPADFDRFDEAREADTQNLQPSTQ
jgi:Holliday junction resolvasome RuvABC DNA-binding subunit